MDAGAVAAAQLRGLGCAFAGLESARAGAPAGARRTFGAAFIGSLCVPFAAGYCRLDHCSIGSTVKRLANRGQPFSDRRPLPLGDVAGIHPPPARSGGGTLRSGAPIAPSNLHPIRGIVSRGSGPVLGFENSSKRTDCLRVTGKRRSQNIGMRYCVFFVNFSI